MSDPVRPLRVCDVCGQVDDHPRHLVSFGPGEAPPVDQAMIASIVARDDLSADVRASIVADLADTTLQLRHMDCCRTVGCPTGDCLVTSPPELALTGDALLAHIQSQGA